MNTASIKTTNSIRILITATALNCCVWGQTTPPSGTTPAPAAAPASGGTFSIEADIFGYKSLHSDSEAIACDVGRYLSQNGAPVGLPRPAGQSFDPGTSVCEMADRSRAFDKNVVLVGSLGATMANFQVWRTEMLLMKDLIVQSKKLKPPPPPKSTGEPREADLTSSLSVAGQAITTIQGLIGLFASNQSSTGIAGTIPDQALMNDVGRQLRNLGVRVVMPDTYSPYSFAGINPANSPFITTLAALLDEHTRLQEVMQRNQVIVNTAQKLQADLTAEAADKAKLPAATGADKQSLQNDIMNLDAEISLIRQQLNGIDVGLAQATVTQAQSLISAIEAFLANLSGGSLAFSSQSPAPTPAPSSPPAGGGNTPAPGGNTTAAAAPAPAAAAAAPAPAATPPIVAAFLGDGLARAMGVSANDDNVELAFAKWRVLWLKTMESGGSLVTTSNILGSKVHFSGGAVASYGMFRLDGDLLCSGVAFAYGGYVEAKDFAEEMKKRNVDPRTQLVFLRGGCGVE